MSFCSNCGKAIETAAGFCSNCGAVVGSPLKELGQSGEGKRCDLCPGHLRGEGTLVSSEEMRIIAGNDYGKNLTHMAWGEASQAERNQKLYDIAMVSEDDWLLCNECFDNTRDYAVDDPQGGASHEMARDVLMKPLLDALAATGGQAYGAFDESMWGDGHATHSTRPAGLGDGDVSLDDSDVYVGDPATAISDRDALVAIVFAASIICFLLTVIVSAVWLILDRGLGESLSELNSAWKVFLIAILHGPTWKTVACSALQSAVLFAIVDLLVTKIRSLTESHLVYTILAGLIFGTIAALLGFTSLPEVLVEGSPAANATFSALMERYSSDTSQMLALAHCGVAITLGLIGLFFCGGLGYLGVHEDKTLKIAFIGPIMITGISLGLSWWSSGLWEGLSWLQFLYWTGVLILHGSSSVAVLFTPD